MILLAQLEPDIHWRSTLYVLGGLVGLLSVVWLILSVAIACKKLFGKHPPVHEELAKLREEFLQGDETLLAALQLETTERQKAIEKIQAQRTDSLRQLDKRFERVMFALGKIAGRFNVDIEPTE